MKNILFSAITLLFATMLSVQAQAQDEKSAVLKFWDDTWKAYQSNDEAKMWASYDENACEVYPDGSHLCGLKTIKEGYEQFKTMMDGQPKWTVDAPQLTMIDAKTALIIANVTTDIKLKGGQQIGGKSTFAAIMSKAHGQWKIVFDSQTPVVNMGN